MTRRGIFEVSVQELADWLLAKGEPAYRARQVREWVLARRARDFSQMTNLPKALRERLTEDWRVLATRVARDQGDGDGTHKLLLALADDRSIECVLLPEEDRRTICVSTQVGCGMGCVFCASGLGGVERNLTTGEIIEQMLQLRDLLPEGERLTHIVVMGMGEPLANLDALLPALELATAPDGLGIGGRHVTISTVGLPAKIRQLAVAGRAYHLAVSLHAPDDTLRQRIVPMAEKVRLSDILVATDEFKAKTGRQVTFEYVLLGDINDDEAHAAQLAKLLAGRGALINLIPYNPVAGLPYTTPPVERTGRFADILRRAGLVVKIRKRKGARIGAACGQLRRQVGPLTILEPASP